MMMTMVVVVAPGRRFMCACVRLCWPKLNDTRRTPVAPDDGGAAEVVVVSVAKCMRREREIVLRLVWRVSARRSATATQSGARGQQIARSKLSSVCVCLRVFFSRTRTRRACDFRDPSVRCVPDDMRCTHTHTKLGLPACLCGCLFSKSVI